MGEDNGKNSTIINTAAKRIRSITVTITNTSNAVFSIAYQRDVPPDQQSGPLDLLSNPLIAEAGEIIKVSAANANRLHVVLSAMEVTPRNVTT
jgi:hypothetical protein